MFSSCTNKNFASICPNFSRCPTLLLYILLSKCGHHLPIYIHVPICLNFAMFPHFYECKSVLQCASFSQCAPLLIMFIYDSMCSTFSMCPHLLMYICALRCTTFSICPTFTNVYLCPNMPQLGTLFSFSYMSFYQSYLLY